MINLPNGLHGIKQDNNLNFYYSCNGNNLMILDHDKYDNKLNIIKKIVNKNNKLDGIIFYKKFINNLFYWEYYNIDGSNVEFCGNGTRCLAKYIFEQEDLNKIILINNFNIITNIYKEESNIWTQMPIPFLDDDFNINPIKKYLIKNFPEHKINYICKVTVGVPHLVIFFDNINDLNIDLNKIALFINNIIKINVNIFYHVDNIIYMRTWEKGVNRETVSCGSGSTAVAYCCSSNIHAQTSDKLNTTFIKIKFLKDNNFINIKKIDNNFYLSGIILKISNKKNLV